MPLLCVQADNRSWEQRGHDISLVAQSCLFRIGAATIANMHHSLATEITLQKHIYDTSPRLNRSCVVIISMATLEDHVHVVGQVSCKHNLTMFVLEGPWPIALASSNNTKPFADNATQHILKANEIVAQSLLRSHSTQRSHHPWSATVDFLLARLHTVHAAVLLETTPASTAIRGKSLHFPLLLLDA